MKQFETLRQLDNYIPECVICKKPMQITLHGDLLVDSPKSYRSREKIKMKISLENGVYSGQHKRLLLNIRSEDNFFINGMDWIKNFKHFSAVKGCRTCDFKITTTLESGRFGVNDLGGKSYLPTLVVQSEGLHLTLKGGFDLKIVKNYGWSDTDDKASIMLNHKQLPYMAFDFSKVKDLDFLNKRIGTIKVFH